MLHEMGVHVWWPASPMTEALPLVAAPAPAAPSAIEIRAIDAISTRARGSKDLKNEPPPQVAVALPVPISLASDMANMDWLSLTHAVANCQACALAQGRRAPVFGAADAPQRADWLLVGEPPDEAEERLGAPFADATGQLLDNMLKAVGVSRRAGGAPVSSAYLTNVVKCRPARVRNPQPEELAVCEQYLRQEVALVQPKVILALGRFAAQTLLQASHPELAGTPLGKLRGRVYRYQGIAVVVTYHPSYLLRTQQDKARAWADLCLALAQSRV